MLKLLVLALILTACMPQSSNFRATSQDNSSADASDPNFSSSLNYLQNGATQTSTTLTVAADFLDSLYLRGKGVHNFISGGNTSVPYCLITYFPNSLTNKLLVLAAIPSSIYNYTDNSIEYYYKLYPAKLSSNQAFCQTAGLTNQLGVDYSGATLAFSFENICPACSSAQLVSTQMKIYSSSGVSVSEINSTSLNLALTVTASSESSGTGISCGTSPQCIAQGYDCCSNGQCINDGELKPGASSDPDYQTAINDVATNPGNTANWPNIYYSCTTYVQPEPTPTPTVDPGYEADERFNKLKRLYECTTPLEGEMSVCSVTYSDASTSGAIFKTTSDDRSFTYTYSGEPASYSAGITPLTGHSIYEVIYAGDTVYQERQTPSGFTISGSNDSISSGDYASLTSFALTPSSSAPNDDLIIRYMVDGSCSKINEYSAKCYKMYVQGQNLGRIDDHYPGTNQFIIPHYADLTKTIRVEVDGDAAIRGSHWNLFSSTKAYVQFDNTKMKVYDTQSVKIIFYVDISGSNSTLLDGKEAASAEINSMCGCGGTIECSLKPQTETVSGVETITDYVCEYPQPDTAEAPMYQTVYVNAKTVPHRFFDEQGAAQTSVTSAVTQEGTAFAYTNNNLLKPNNVSNYIGFNEIYGSFNSASGSAQPAMQVSVTKNRTYDIYSNSGSFSTCYYCGSDYYTSIAKIFPQNFVYEGGGYQPNPVSTNPSSLTSSYPYRKDDLLFGRACFLPVTMIPWGHYPFSDVQQQRLRRLQAQHFLFANGYQRDWYGFDYGALIGSFDGVFWFAIGTQRRIKATSNKLFLAINAYFGDLTTNSTYTVNVADASLNPTTGYEITNDFASDGAECQKYHQCQTDSDCITQLGWDYACENVTSIKAAWPKFDNNAKELPDIDGNVLSIYGRIGSTSAGAKRCVYRGRGAPCHTDPVISDTTDSYAQTLYTGIHACLSNSYCQKLNEGGIPEAKFNTKISRYGKSVVNRNATNGDAEHTFGLGSPIIGRPYSFHGTEEAPSEVQANLFANKVESICLPGRNPTETNFASQHSSTPIAPFKGEQVLNIGFTHSGTSSADISDNYLSSCAVLDEDGNYFSIEEPDADLDNATIKLMAGTQAIAANALMRFSSSVFTSIEDTELLKDFDNQQITSAAYQYNSCLRAPGSVCFSDMDCAPNNLITNKITQIDAEAESGTTTLNKYEIKFWQEGLVCGQSVSKYLSDGTPNPDYNLKNNRCCRESNNTITIGSSTDTTLLDNANVPGIDTSFDSAKRYSRISTVYNKLNTDGSTYPPLLVASGTSSTDDLIKQYNTFSYIGENSCCSGNWVRNFHKTANGGGHTWGPKKMQNISKEAFRCMNWIQDTGGLGSNFTCSDPDAIECLIRNVSTSEAKKVFEWLNSLELLGIPQIAIKDENHSEIYCKVDPDDQSAAASYPLGDPFATGATTEYTDTSANAYYSASDTGNFKDSLKMVFSSDEITCCVPAGEAIGENDSEELCCTGYVNPDTGLCALKDYSNVSVYFNRYVSSAAKGLAATLFDTQTGFIKDPSIVEQLACYNRVCRSDRLARGISLSNQIVPGTEDTEFSSVLRKFYVEDNTETDGGLGEFYDAGLRWNIDVYCVPDGVEADDTTGNFTIIDCSN